MDSLTALLERLGRFVLGRRRQQPARFTAEPDTLASKPEPDDRAPRPPAPQLTPRTRAVIVLIAEPEGSRVVVAIGHPGRALLTQAFTSSEASRPTHQRLGLDAFEWLLDQCRDLPGEPAEVYVDYGALRRELLLLAASFPKVRLLPAATDAHLALIQASGGTPPDTTPEASPRSARPHSAPTAAVPPRVVATDASLARHRSGAGIACVDASGTFAQGFARTSSIAVAELRAIELALGTFPADDLVVLSDSRQALAWLACPARVSDPDIRRLLAAVGVRMAGRLVRFDWVKGHNGHPLNETADRLAMAARRAREFGQDEKLRRRIASDIVGDLVAA